MHFSTKERVPLLVCLEVEEKQLPRTPAVGRSSTSLPEASARASCRQPGLRGLGSSAAPGANEAFFEGGAEALAGEEACGGCGEAGLMDRFRGTVRSFVQVRRRFVSVRWES